MGARCWSSPTCSCGVETFPLCTAGDSFKAKRDFSLTHWFGDSLGLFFLHLFCSYCSSSSGLRLVCVRLRRLSPPLFWCAGLEEGDGQHYHPRPGRAHRHHEQLAFSQGRTTSRLRVSLPSEVHCGCRRRRRPDERSFNSVGGMKVCQPVIC